MVAMASLKPLSARSVIVSLILGAHPRGMSAREIVQAGEYFGVPAASARVALTRGVASGDLVRHESGYEIGARLAARTQRQAVEASEEPWDGRWELAVVVTTARPSNQRAALRQVLTDARLAELREGVWMRPANLDRSVPEVDGTVHRFTATPSHDPAALAQSLWDLEAWSAGTSATLTALDVTTEPAQRLTLAAHLVRQLSADPLLPPQLWPADWPAPVAQQTYADFQREVLQVVTSTGHVS